MRLLVLLSLIVFAAANIIRSEGQAMDEERILRLLRDFVALESNEVPGFETKGGVITRTRWWDTVSLNLYQSLRRKGVGVLGRDPTDILIKAFLLPNRDTAYQVAIDLTTSQLALTGKPGMGEGSCTGMPIGEKSWATAAKAKEPGPGLGSAILVVWDGKLALRVDLDYQPIDPKAKTAIFLPVVDEDLELGELAARLVLAKANLVLLGWKELPTVRLVVNGKNLEAKKTKEGNIFVPVQVTLREMGGKAERKLGVILASWKGKKVTLPISARVMLVGKEKVALNLPILWDGKEGWVEGTGMAKSLGLALRWEEGKLVLAKR